MRDRPTGPQLLRHARAVLLDELTDLLPEERHHQARLLAETLAIAAREQEAGAAPLEAEWGVLAELYGEDAAPPARAAETLEEALLRLNWRLAAEIRGAKRDAEARVYALLRATAIARLRESNPKALDDAGMS